MKTEEFREYLKIKFHNSPSAVNSTITNCRRVEKYQGDIDEHYLKDKCKELIFLLSYTSEDEKLKRIPKHNIPTGGNVKNISASYKKCVRLYCRFCLQNEVVPNNEQNLNIEHTNGFKQTNSTKEYQLNLRSIDNVFENSDELDDFFIESVVAYSEDHDDEHDCLGLSYRYFKSVEGEWCYRKNEESSYIKITPAKVEGSSKLQNFFNDLFERTESKLYESLSDLWSEDEDCTSPMTDDDIFLAKRDDDEIKRNITG